ncbi:MAG TPA: MFS transporter [Steroidobacteraceae bacterium]|nr:MFS transporter [Steroidobacteraceae bacterium]
MATPPNAAAPLFSRGYRAWLLAMLVLTNGLNLADRLGLAASAQAIKLDLKFTDSKLGILQGLGFAIFYTLMGLPIARLAEHLSRARIIAACLALFGTMSALCSTAHSFTRLLLFRVGVGVGDAGFGPPVSSLVADHYPLNRRASVMAIVWLGAPLGVVIGSAGAGWLTEHVSWRATFIVIGSLAVLVALLAFLTLREPPRGLSDPAAALQGPPPAMSAVVRFLFAKRSMCHILFGCALAATAMNGIGQFINPFMARNYHLGPAQAGALLALIAGGSMASGLLLGGFGTDWAGRFDKRWYVWGPALGLVLSAPLFLLGFNEPRITSSVALLIAAHVCMFLYYTPTIAMAQNMVGANMRATSQFFVSLVLGLVGIGLGPTLVGLLSDRFAARSFALGTFAAACPGGRAPAGSGGALAEACRNASAIGLRHALMVITLLCVWAALHYLLAARSLRRDLETRFEAAAVAPGPAVATSTGRV